MGAQHADRGTSTAGTLGTTDTDCITITGAREHNLKDVDVEIPKGRITVFTGVSGSGKSSLVFDTVAVESQRQLNETYTWYVRNQLPKHERPKADTIERLAPAIVVDQRPVGGGARSTVGTMTDIHAVLRVLFSRCGTPSAGEATAYSFNDPAGMCPECAGLGRTTRIDLDRFLDTGRSLNEGAIRFPPLAVGTAGWQIYATSGLFDPDEPLERYGPEKWDLLLYGKGFKVKRGERGYNNTYEGLVEHFDRRYVKRGLAALPEKTREMVRAFAKDGTCPRCRGGRLTEAALKSQVAGRNIAEMAALEVTELSAVLRGIDPADEPVGAAIAARAVTALDRLTDIGLGYLSLDRPTDTLSGGEGQRLKTVRHLGSSLTGMTYIFDEPSTGLHPSDVRRLNDLLVRLRDKGNTVLVVEHDRDVIAIADHVVDMGPGAGAQGGEVVYAGTVRGLAAADTPTGRGLRRVTDVKKEPRRPGGLLTVRDVTLHNLKGVDFSVPTGVLTVVTGVAGSGKSTLVSGAFVGAHPEAIVVDQSAIGVSARSTPATYLGVMDAIRTLFARANGVPAGLFSFNSAGACEACRGRGEIHTDLAYLDPVTTTCETCRGRRFKDDVLGLTLGRRSIADVLEMTGAEAQEFFAGGDGGGGGTAGVGESGETGETDESGAGSADRQTAGGDETAGIVRKLAALIDVGLGYLTLGQSVSSLSGGERQRLKLATRLHRTGSLYVLDEPTTGLHMADVDGLLDLLDRLVDGGNTVLVIEHDLDVVKRADWVVDLGPGGGRRGGEIVFAGTPRDLVSARGSVTAACLRASLDGGLLDGAL
ncbi:excinuclease ABC subunit UvrA [Streptomyces albofaciens JCM 4342]|uniref:ATP-binding cassette domain-containing protein n=1 Tax=Streptomyces albofaciens TaxID=66866 RepID=UPI001238C15C|nr:excinuclease ABC subunit UvrA [Streptomyces albofaciens]KAA6222057.1 excinuclease ABC subunit UvrA [Streptomyces albofaciens JCM 4342]